MSLFRCPMDGCLIPQVAEVCVGSEKVSFFWCKWCEELFAALGEPDRDAADFAKDDQGGWRVFRALGSESDVQLAMAAAAQVNPDALR